MLFSCDWLCVCLKMGNVFFSFDTNREISYFIKGLSEQLQSLVKFRDEFLRLLLCSSSRSFDLKFESFFNLLSSLATVSSMTHCLVQESSIVGSQSVTKQLCNQKNSNQFWGHVSVTWNALLLYSITRNLLKSFSIQSLFYLKR